MGSWVILSKLLSNKILRKSQYLEATKLHIDYKICILILYFFKKRLMSVINCPSKDQTAMFHLLSKMCKSLTCDWSEQKEGTKSKLKKQLPSPQQHVLLSGCCQHEVNDDIRNLF